MIIATENECDAETLKELHLNNFEEYMNQMFIKS